MMTSADHLILDAKQALLEEQYRRFRALQDEGKVEEAALRLQATLRCAADLLACSVRMLEQIVAAQQHKK